MEDKVIISKSEYRELTGKAAIYDAYARKLKADADKGEYVLEYEQAMFIEDASKVDVDVATEAFDAMFQDEGMEAFFSEEEWGKIEELAKEEEKEEDDFKKKLP